jgi:hypothetical protein
MDRIALSNRLKGMSEVFASDNEIAQDLSAMSYVIANMSDEKFSTIINPDVDGKEAGFGANVDFGGGKNYTPSTIPSKEQAGRFQVGKINPNMDPVSLGYLIDYVLKGEKVNGKKQFLSSSEAKEVKKVHDMYQAKLDEAIRKMEMEEMKGDVTPSAVPAVAPRMASEDSELEDVVGMYWTREASDAVANAILKDVLGMDSSTCCDTKRHLDKEQMPDSEKKQETPPTLKGEQIPQDKENHDSGIVEKAKAAKPVNKQAGEDKGPGVPDGTGPGKDSPACKVNNDGDENVTNKSASLEDDSIIYGEGVELSAPMSEVRLSSEDETELSKLFD